MATWVEYLVPKYGLDKESVVLEAIRLVIIRELDYKLDTRCGKFR